MYQYFLLLGTNMGDKIANLEASSRLISTAIGTIITKSSIYITSAWGIEDQDDFLNQVLIVNTEMEANEVLTTCLNIEKEMGRVRVNKWGSRLIDIDILYKDNEHLTSDVLIIPHPEIQNRKFTLEPLAEIAPHYLHPILKKSNLELLRLCSDPLLVRKL